MSGYHSARGRYTQVLPRQQPPYRAFVLNTRGGCRDSRQCPLNMRVRLAHHALYGTPHSASCTLHPPVAAYTHSRYSRPVRQRTPRSAKGWQRLVTSHRRSRSHIRLAIVGVYASSIRTHATQSTVGTLSLGFVTVKGPRLVPTVKLGPFQPLARTVPTVSAR